MFILLLWGLVGFQISPIIKEETVGLTAEGASCGTRLNEQKWWQTPFGKSTKLKPTFSLGKENMEENNTFSFTQIDPRRYKWDEDHEYCHVTGKSHGFNDGYRISVAPNRCDGAPMNIGAHVTIKYGDQTEADFVLDALGMQLLAQSLQEIILEQFAARYIDEH